MLGISSVFREVRTINDRMGLDFGAVAVLFRTAHHPDGIRISDLAESVLLDLSTVSRHVRALEQSGLVGKTHDPNDRRASLVSLTAAGETRLHDLMERRAVLFAEATADWPTEDIQALAALLERLATGLVGALRPQETQGVSS